MQKIKIPKKITMLSGIFHCGPAVGNFRAALFSFHFILFLYFFAPAATHLNFVHFLTRRFLFFPTACIISFSVYSRLKILRVYKVWHCGISLPSHQVRFVSDSRTKSRFYKNKFVFILKKLMFKFQNLYFIIIIYIKKKMTWYIQPLRINKKL